ncbi:MAG: glycosyltransferase family 39 protein [Elusimicrobia bacterium]|nr:glycosyltransferase family 39 protein [Elusimicrobiota bacterium]
MSRLPPPRPALVALFLSAMTLAVYWPSLTHGFVNYDDPSYVAENAAVRGGLSAAGAVAAFRSPPAGYPEPLSMLSHELDVELFGLNPAGHHLTNVLLHLGAVLLLFFALLRMTGDPWPSAFAAAVFAVHPLQVESVAWVAERKTVLNGLLTMLTLFLYAGYARRPSRGRYAAVAAAFALSLAAKSVVVGLPPALLVLDVWPLRRREPLARLALEKLPLLALSALSAALVLAGTRGVAGGIPLDVKAAAAVMGVCAALGRALWPSGLCVLYPYPTAFPPLKIAAEAAALIAATVLAARAARRRPWWLAGWLWFLLMIAPYSGIVQVGDQATADRYMYLALVGPALAAAWGLPELVALPEGAWAAAGGLALSALMVASGLQLRYWRNGLLLFERAASLHPESPVIRYDLGDALDRAGDVPAALAQYRAALAGRPAYVQAADALAVDLARAGRLDESRAVLEEILRLAPADDPKREVLERNLELVRRARPRAREKLSSPHGARADHR